MLVIVLELFPSSRASKDSPDCNDLTSALTGARIGIDVQRHFRRNRCMIKTRIAVMALALSFMAASACFAANPHIGTWKLNEAKSKFAPGMGKNSTVIYTEQGDKIKVTVDGVDKMGNRRTAFGSADSMEKPTQQKGICLITPSPTKW